MKRAPGRPGANAFRLPCAYPGEPRCARPGAPRGNAFSPAFRLPRGALVQCFSLALRFSRGAPGRSPWGAPGQCISLAFRLFWGAPGRSPWGAPGQCISIALFICTFFMLG